MDSFSGQFVGKPTQEGHKIFYFYNLIQPLTEMINTLVKYIKRKLERRRIKTTFKEYDYQVVTLQLPEYGKIEVAQWLNPLLETPYVVSITDVNFYKEFTKEGDFVIDIGAHMGDMTLPMALAIGPKGTVLGF